MLDGCHGCATRGVGGSLLSTVTSVLNNGTMSVNNGRIDDHRRVYDGGSLDESDLTQRPKELFDRWLAEAFENGVRNPHAMVLSTVDAQGTPSSRVVIAKATDDRGVVFCTKYGSRKAEDIENNDRVALLFHWRELDRVVHIEGQAVRVSEEESDEHFNSRPLVSRLGAGSPQSQVIASRDDLLADIAEAGRRAEAGEPVTRPKDWGGYLVVPSAVEFWQGRPDRVHDRFRYRRVNDDWVIERLAP